MACSLCDLPTPDPPITDPEIDGTYCCQGCLHIAENLDDPAAFETSIKKSKSAETSLDLDDGETVFLEIAGMHCTTCEAFLEGQARELPGVAHAAASYSTGLMQVRYDPDQVSQESLRRHLSGLGYRVAEDDDTQPRSQDGGRLLVGGFLGMMAMLWYVLFLYPTYLGMPPDHMLLDVSGPAGVYLLGNLWVLTTVILGYTGYPILRGAYVSIRSGVPNMDLLVALAAGTAYLFSVILLLTGRTEVYFDITIVIVLAVTIGRHYEAKLRARAVGHLSKLTDDRVVTARRRTSEGIEEVAVDELESGDEVVVTAGERIPVDGTVLEDSAVVDEQLLTGEARPIEKHPGRQVAGGTVVTDGRIVVAVGQGAESTVEQLATLVWEIKSSRPSVQRLADRLAAMFVPLVIVLAGIAVLWQLLSGESGTAAILTGLAVLVVSCPCALGLATPLAMAAGVKTGLTRGIVFGDESIFETAPDVDVIAFDKTGTLSTGTMAVVSVVGDNEVVRRAAAVEASANHPVAGAICEYATRVPADAAEFMTHDGAGVSAIVDGDRVVVGRPALLDAQGMDIPGRLRDRANTAVEEGLVPSLVGWDGTAQGLIVAGDQPREGWRSVVSRLAADHEVVVVTGDSDAAAKIYEDHPGVSEVYANARPTAKTAIIEQLGEDQVVAMVGDGTNDAPALGAADFGIAMGSGTALAGDAADAVVIQDELRAVPEVFELAKGTHRRIRENLAWAFLYNVIAIPLAFAGLLNPLFAAVAMATSSLLVVTNSTRSLDPSKASAAASSANTEVVSGLGEFDTPVTRDG